MTDAIRNTCDALAAEISVTYSAEFVPQSKSRNAGKTPSLNWRVTLARDGKTFTTDYMQGIGHVPGSYFSYRPNADNLNTDEVSAERGVFFTQLQRWASANSDHGLKFSGKPIPAPHIADVLYSLVLDADVLNYPRFEDWAPELGYDPDSREGERIYRACLAVALELRALIGDANIARFRAVLQDY